MRLTTVVTCATACSIGFRRINQYDKLVDMDAEDIGAFEAKTRLSELLEKVSRGHVYRITRRGKPVAELRPVPAASGRPTFGADRGRVAMRDGFDDELDDMKAYR
jgi:prevent-host-death family protein